MTDIQVTMQDAVAELDKLDPVLVIDIDEADPDPDTTIRLTKQAFFGHADDEPSPSLSELLATGGFVDAPKLWEGDSEVARCIRNGVMTNMDLIYPLVNPGAGVTGEHGRRIEGLCKFFYSLVPTEPKDLSIFTYQGLVGDEEVIYVRFQTEGPSFTFVTRASRFDRWMEAVLDDETMAWCLEKNPVQAMQDRGMHLNVSKLPIELPLHFFFVPFESTPMDALYNGDFIALETLSEKLKGVITEKLRDATMKANVLVNADVEKDHDLYLVFKAQDNFKTLNVTLDKVFPKLPESGQVALGENPTTIFEWNGCDKKVMVAIKQINNCCKHINKAIRETREMLSQNPIIQKEFDEKLKVILYAATHFTKRIYGFGAEYGKQMVQDVANDVIRKLTTKAATGASIGLDLNSWIVWEYHEGTHPTRSEDPEVDFVNDLFNRYTESFIEALYAFLINTGNPLIRPYDYREVADLSDGIPLGTIRRVK